MHCGSCEHGLQHAAGLLVLGIEHALRAAALLEVQRPGGEEAALRIAALSVALAFAALAASELLARRLRQRIGG